jgi:hypothetical protein
MASRWAPLQRTGLLGLALSCTQESPPGEKAKLEERLAARSLGRDERGHRRELVELVGRARQVLAQAEDGAGLHGGE